jgi:hypothetical protein
MFVFVTIHTVYHSKLLSLHFGFFLEFNICHRFGWVYPRCVCCSKCSFLCSALRIIVCFFSLYIELCMYSICLTKIDFPFDISKRLDIALSVLRFTAFASFWYILITPSIFFNFSFCTLWSPLWCILITSLFFSDYALDIFRSLRLYLLITPLVSSDYDFGIFWLPPLVSSDKLIVFFWLTPCYFQRLWGIHWDCQSFLICLPSHKRELPRYDNLRNIIKIDGVHWFTQQIPRI